MQMKFNKANLLNIQIWELQMQILVNLPVLHKIKEVGLLIVIIIIKIIRFLINERKKLIYIIKWVIFLRIFF